MKISSKKRKELTSTLSILRKCATMVLINYHSIGSEHILKIRLEASSKRVTIKIVPLSILKIALESLGSTLEALDSIRGQLLCAFGNDLQDLASIAKQMGTANIRFGITNLTVLVPRTLIVSIANIPSREVLNEMVCLTLELPTKSLVETLEQYLANRSIQTNTN